MKKNIRAIILAASATLIVGCATTAPSGESFNAVQLSTAMYGKKADTFVIVQDASSSMGREHMDMGHSKLDMATKTLSNMNQTIPQLDFNSGLTVFGNGVGTASVLYGLAPYSRDGLASGIAKVTSAGGPTPLGEGINTTNSELLTGLGLGQIAMFIVSDGIPNVSNAGGPSERDAAIAAAKTIILYIKLLLLSNYILYL